MASAETAEARRNDLERDGSGRWRAGQGSDAVKLGWKAMRRRPQKRLYGVQARDGQYTNERGHCKDDCEWAWRAPFVESGGAGDGSGEDGVAKGWKSFCMSAAKEEEVANELWSDGVREGD